MGILKNIKHERFAQERARGTDRKQAFLLAGFAPSGSGPFNLEKRLDVQRRIGELMERRIAVDEESTKEALARACITKYDIAVEMKAIGMARMDHFTTVDAQGHPFLDLKKLEQHPEYWAAVKEVIVEEYTEGRGDDARDVKRTRIELHDKQGALKTLATMHGMVDRGPKINLGVAVQVVMTEDELRA